MSSTLEAKTAMRQLAAEAQAIVQDPRLNAATKTAKVAKIEADIKAHAATIDLHEQISRLGILGESGEVSHDSGRRAKGLHAGIAAQGYRPIEAPQIELSPEQTEELYDAAVSHKSFAVSTKTPTDSTSIGPATITDYQLPPVSMRREPTRVLSLIPTFATAHPSVTWYSTTGTTAAAAVAEGGTKPTSTIAYTAQTGTVTKLAHVAEITDETLADFQGFMAVLQDDMISGLFKAENAELLTATVTGAHKFAGLLNTSGILTAAVPGSPTQNDRLDSISAAFDSLRTGSSFTEPDGIIMHPTDWGTIRRNKDSQNRYLLGDPGTGTDPRIWGIPVVLTSQITLGTCLIGAFSTSVAAYVRDGVRIETANQGTAQFTGNSVLVRAEERLLLTVPRPSGLLKLTGL